MISRNDRCRLDGLIRGAWAITRRSEGATYRKIGEEIGVSVERVRQIKEKAERMIRHNHKWRRPEVEWMIECLAEIAGNRP